MKVALLALYQLGQGAPPGFFTPTPIIPPPHGKLHYNYECAQANIDPVPGMRLIAPAPPRRPGNSHCKYVVAQANTGLAPVLQWAAPWAAPWPAPWPAPTQGKPHDEYGYAQADIYLVPAHQPAASITASGAVPAPLSIDQEVTDDDNNEEDVMTVEDDGEPVFTDINQFLGSDDGLAGLSETQRRTQMDEFIDQVSFETKIELSDEDVEELNELSARNKELFLKFYNRGGLAGTQAR